MPLTTPSKLLSYSPGFASGRFAAVSAASNRASALAKRLSTVARCAWVSRARLIANRPLSGPPSGPQLGGGPALEAGLLPPWGPESMDRSVDGGDHSRTAPDRTPSPGAPLHRETAPPTSGPDRCGVTARGLLPGPEIAIRPSGRRLPDPVSRRHGQEVVDRYAVAANQQRPPWTEGCCESIHARQRIRRPTALDLDRGRQPPRPRHEVHLAIALTPVEELEPARRCCVGQVRTHSRLHQSAPEGPIGAGIVEAQPTRSRQQRCVEHLQLGTRSTLSDRLPGELGQALEQPRRRQQIEVVRQRGRVAGFLELAQHCLLYTSPSPRD